MIDPRPVESGARQRRARAMMTRARLRSPTGIILFVQLVLPATTRAQVMPSERASVSQTVDGTVIQVEYSRPRARGRSQLFGSVVEWGRVWTAGANEATVLDLSRNVTLQGAPVAAGRWSVWFVVREEGPWNLILDPRPDLWHTAHPEPADDQVRVSVAPEPADHVEALTWSFPDVHRAGTTLTMGWGTLRVSLEIEVEPTARYAMSREEAGPYVGRWEIERRQGSAPGLVRALDIVHVSDGSLRAIVPADGEHDRREWVLQPRAHGIFAIGWTRNGELWSGSDVLLEMTVGEGRATDFVVRDGADDIIHVGRRIR